MALEKFKDKAREKISSVVDSVKENAGVAVRVLAIITATSAAALGIVSDTRAEGEGGETDVFTLERSFSRIPRGLAHDLGIERGENRISIYNVFRVNGGDKIRLEGPNSRGEDTVRDIPIKVIADYSEAKIQRTGDPIVRCDGENDCEARVLDVWGFETELGNSFTRRNGWKKNGQPFINDGGTCSSDCVYSNLNSVAPYPGGFISVVTNIGSCRIPENHNNGLLYEIMPRTEFLRTGQPVANPNIMWPIMASKRHVYETNPDVQSIVAYPRDPNTGVVDSRNGKPLGIRADLRGLFENEYVECVFMRHPYRGDNPVYLCHFHDDDKDGILNQDDNCPDVYNPGKLPAGTIFTGTRLESQKHLNQPDRDRDGLGDAWARPCGVHERPDECGFVQACDPCPLDPYNDGDSDTVCGNEDNCKDIANPDQLDTDRDGIGDLCDALPNFVDKDKDGISDDIDNCPRISNQNQRDSDNDNKGDRCDPCNPPPDSRTLDEARNNTCPLATKLRIMRELRQQGQPLSSAAEKSENVQGCSCETVAPSDISLLALGIAEMIRRRLRMKNSV